MILIDLLSPSVRSAEDVDRCMPVALRKDVRVVVAQSSAFLIYTTLEPMKTTQWVECFNLANHIIFQPWIDLAEEFLKSISLGDRADKVGELIRYCKGSRSSYLDVT